MVHQRDEYVMAAHDVYVSDQDVDDLIDTLQRIAKREVEAGNKSDDEDEDDQDEDEDFDETDRRKRAQTHGNFRRF